MRTSYKKYNSINYSKYIMIFISILFIVGFIYGNFITSYSSESLDKYIGEIVNNFISSRNNQTIFKTLSYSFFSSGSIILLSYLTGFWGIGHIITATIPIFKGMGVGLIFSYIYSTYQLKGFLYCITIILVPNLLYILCIIISCKESIKLSSIIFANFMPSKKLEINNKIVKTYTIKHIIIISICFISSILDSLLNFIVSGLFNFNL